MAHPYSLEIALVMIPVGVSRLCNIRSSLRVGAWGKKIKQSRYASEAIARCQGLEFGAAPRDGPTGVEGCFALGENLKVCAK